MIYHTKQLKSLYSNITESDFIAYLQSLAGSSINVQLSNIITSHYPITYLPHASTSLALPSLSSLPSTPFDLSIPSTLSDSSTYLLPILPHIPLLHERQQNVGVRPQVLLFQGVTKYFHACRFLIKQTGQINRNSAGHKDIPLLRNLFFPSPKEISELERLLENDFYSLLMEAIGTEMGRNEFKTEFFHFLYRPAPYKPETSDPVRDAFKALLPSITHFLDLCKCRPGTLEPWGTYYKWISRAMISLESKIILECCAELWKKFPDMFLVTVHDCIKCLPQDVGKVKEELERTYAKYNVLPKFDVKHHKKPSNPN